MIAMAERFIEEPTPESFRALEESALRACGLLASHFVAGVVHLLHTDAEWVQGAVDAARAAAPHPTRLKQWRESPVQFLGGARLMMRTPYVARDLRGRRGRKRGVGRRGPAGTGTYPVFAALGIDFRATPAVQSVVATQSVRGASTAEARAALAERGIELNSKTVRSITLRVGERALEQRQTRMEVAQAGEVSSDEFANLRIAIGVDGGRLRLREGGMRGPRRKSGHRPFDTAWKEPKVFVIYVFDKRGKRVREIPVLYDGTMGDADATFKILTAELLLRGAAKAKEIALIGDGAQWIWNRADALAKALGLEATQIVKVADFYHAVEHLTQVAELRRGWTEKRRKRWVRDMRALLKDGRVADVIGKIEKLCCGPNTKKLRTELEYFRERKDMMRYRAYRRRGIPLGSGAVESAVRRIVNLRLKGPAIFWREENAERMLHLRAYFKAGRWDELMTRVFDATAPGRRTRGLAHAA
jgi:hypothetical protein